LTQDVIIESAPSALNAAKHCQNISNAGVAMGQGLVLSEADDFVAF